MTVTEAVERAAETSRVPTTAELLLEWDRRRPRSKQREFGMSELGGCRRRAGYRLAGVEMTNVGSSVQAVMGTAIHEAVAGILQELQDEGAVPANWLIESEVTFAGILGHLDRCEDDILRDVKTTTSWWLRKLKQAGKPTNSHLWQVMGYAAARIKDGHPVRRVGIDYLARDTGEEWRWEGDFNPAVVREALEWVRTVRETELQFLPRDHEPDSAFCQHCPFRDLCWDGSVQGRDDRSVLYVEKPDAEYWITELDEARKAKADAEKREKRAKGALDALRPNDKGSELVDVGSERGVLKFSVTSPFRIDTDAVRREYEAAGAKPPLKPPSREVRLEIVAREEAS